MLIFPCSWQQAYQVMRDCWNKNPKVRPKFKNLLLVVTRLYNTKQKMNKNNRDLEAWNNNGHNNAQRRNSFNLNIYDKDVEDYDVTATASYDYEVFKTVQKNIS